MNNDKLIIGGHEFNSRFILGSGKYSMKLIESAVKDAGAEIITLAVRRANTIKTRKVMKYFYLCGDEESDVQSEGSLVASRVMLCAAHQAHTVLRILAGELETK